MLSQVVEGTAQLAILYMFEIQAQLLGYVYFQTISLKTAVFLIK